MNKKTKLICCRALSHLLEPLIDPQTERAILPIRLHLNQHNLNQALQDEVNRLEEPGVDLLLGYGLCGRGVEGVSSQKSRLILPRIDDCVDAVLGSNRRNNPLFSETAGIFFLEPQWIDTEVDIFSQCLKGLEKIPQEYRQEIVHMALKHYSKLVLIHHGRQDSGRAADRCATLAERYGLEFMQILSDLTLLEDLARGDYTPNRFVITEPGEKIPYF